MFHQEVPSPKYILFIYFRFSDGKLKNALVVLDDVTDSSVIRAFSLGCKILITTKNSKLMTFWASQTTMIEVKPNMTL
jgi:hypothetical protein